MLILRYLWIEVTMGGLTIDYTANHPGQGSAPLNGGELNGSGGNNEAIFANTIHFASRWQHLLFPAHQGGKSANHREQLHPTPGRNQ